MIRPLVVAIVFATMGATAAHARDPARAKILILTGNEYPGHKWQETAPLIAKFLGADHRLTAEVNADPNFLAAPQLHAYAAIVLNYLNWKCPDPGEPAHAHLKKFVEQGKGLVYGRRLAARGSMRSGQQPTA